MSDVKPFVLPDAGSWLARIYVYWLKTTGAEIPWQENFCHFWRVVLLWAPLEWLFLAKRGWRGMFRPYEVLALVLFVAAFVGFAPVVGINVGVGETMAWLAWAVVGTFGTAAFYEEELNARKKDLRWGLVCSGFWGTALLGFVGIYLVALYFGEGYERLPRYPELQRPPKRPSETAEFIRRLLGQIHARVCPPVEFKFDLAKAVGRGRDTTDWDD